MPRLKRAQQEFFCQEYLIDGNCTAAAKRAGYSPKTARVQGSKLLTNPDVKARISELMDKREKRTGIDADWVLTRLAELADFKLSDIYEETGAMKDVHSMSDAAQRALTSIKRREIFEMNNGHREHVGDTVEARIIDPLRVLELMGKHVKVSAFEENVNLSEFGSLGDRIRRAQKRMGIRGRPDGDD